MAHALNEQGKPVRGSHILIVGASYKGGVGDVRESPALKIMRLLADCGARLRYHDEYVPELPELGLSSMPLEQALQGADCAALVTVHPELDVGRLVADAPLLVDFRGVTRGVVATAPTAVG